MRWQCRYHNSNGIRCENEACKRIHFSGDHPFDHTDLCDVHFKEYKSYVWVQDISNYGEARLM
jgi:hypothetical protein